ncbi:uncharacterized protein [Haliotis cracherodii]|uniref:uncharacterized protein n=1 Tax=Haliotis cracherodii TaxID=6455 RepID=UPI0039EC67EC
MEGVVVLYITLALIVNIINGKIPPPNVCGSFYHHRPEFDNKLLSNGLLEILYPGLGFKWTDCFTKCFYHSKCNVVLLNRNNNHCKLFDNNDKDLSNASPDPGSQYWAADCEFYKVPNADVSTATGCSSIATPVTDPNSINSVCYTGGSWRTRTMCGQTLWVEPTQTVFKIPSPLVTGVTIEVIGSRLVETPIYLMLKDPSQRKVASLLWTDVNWGGFSIYIDEEEQTGDGGPFSIASQEEFTLVVTITSTKFEGVLNGVSYYSGDRLLPLETYTSLHSDGYHYVRKIHIMYP